MKRFEIRYGRFGAYFYDNKIADSIDLESVLEYLNNLIEERKTRNSLQIKQ